MQRMDDAPESVAPDREAHPVDGPTPNAPVQPPAGARPNARPKHAEEGEPAADERGFSVRDRRFWVQEGAGEGAGEGASGEAGEEPAPAERKPSYVAELERQLDEKDARLKQYIEAHRQAQRQFEESRERLQRDVQRQIDQGRADLVARFFPVLDDLERALEAVEGPPHGSAAAGAGADAVREGVRIVHRKFMDTLTALGLERVDPTGEPFDPNVHDALSLVPVTDPAQDNVVQQVFRPGYRTGDRVLRHAVVLVGRCSSQPETTPGDPDPEE